jgi:nucleoside-diphosphate-sugar epimerase
VRAKLDAGHDVCLAGAQTVLGLAVEHGMRRIIHVSSLCAIFDPNAGMLHSGLL